MADEFQAAICEGNWWNSTLLLRPAAFGSSSLCSPIMNHMGSTFAWPADLMDMKARCSDELSGSANSEGSIVFQEKQNNNKISMDSTLEMMGGGLSSSITTTDWNQTFLSKIDENLNSRPNNYQEDASVDDYCDQIKKDWSPDNFSTIDDQESSMNAFKATNPVISLASYGYPSSLMDQTLFGNDCQRQDYNIFKINDQSMDCNQATADDCRAKLNDFSSFSTIASLLKPSMPKQQTLNNHLNLLSNNKAPFWNSSAAAINDVGDGFLSPVQSQFLSPKFEDKLSCPSNNTKAKNERIRDMSSVVKKNSSAEQAFKRPRIQTPSPLPTFKVRKEKLGDRITALQQLVSPFGKTDTASVLHEAIEYIKLLHDQVNVLSTPYLKNGSPVQREQTSKKSKGSEEVMMSKDLRSRGLCLVPISSTFPVATETSADFWTPTFGASLLR